MKVRVDAVWEGHRRWGSQVTERLERTVSLPAINMLDVSSRIIFGSFGMGVVGKEKGMESGLTIR